MNDLTPEQLAAIRKGIRAARASGMPDTKLDEYLTQTYKITAAEAMKPTGRDADRAIMQGVTLGHADELYGLYKKLTGGDYTTARDQVRENGAQASAANPWTMGVTSAIGGAAPAALASLIPGMAPVAGATGMNALRGAAMGGGLGAVGGAGESTAPTMGGVARDAALGGAVGGVLGGAGGAVASKLAGSGLPKGSPGVVAREAATQLPTDPVQLHASLARQEALAPGSVVLADISPEMRSLVRGIGADPRSAALAKKAAEQRLASITAARRTVGSSYDMLKGRLEPTDPEIITALAQSGRRNMLKRGAKEIELDAVKKLRSTLLGEARATRNPAVAQEKQGAAEALTNWLVKKEPAVSQMDADYAFLTDRVKAAKTTLTDIKNSSKNYATSRAYDVEPASAGASLPTIRSGPGIAIKAVGKVFGTDRAARAKAVNDLLLSPNRTQGGLAQLIQMHDLLLNPPSQAGLRSVSAGLAGLSGMAGAGTVSQLQGGP